MTRGWFYLLQFLLVLASAVIVRSESRWIHYLILLSQIRDSPNMESQVPVFISPGTGWSGYTPRHQVLFSTPPVTRRATVELFDPASKRDPSCLKFSLHNLGVAARENTVF
jgi:hypothetical protein